MRLDRGNEAWPEPGFWRGADGEEVAPMMDGRSCRGPVSTRAEHAADCSEPRGRRSRGDLSIGDGGKRGEGLAGRRRTAARAAEEAPWRGRDATGDEDGGVTKLYN